MKVFTDDDIQIKAPARALGVPLRVEYLSGESKDLYTPQHSKDDDMPRSTCCQNYHHMSSDFEVLLRALAVHIGAVLHYLPRAVIFGIRGA